MLASHACMHVGVYLPSYLESLSAHVAALSRSAPALLHDDHGAHPGMSAPRPPAAHGTLRHHAPCPPLARALIVYKAIHNTE